MTLLSKLWAGYVPSAGVTGMKGTLERTESGKPEEVKNDVVQKVSVFTLSLKKGGAVYRVSESRSQKNKTAG
jgi:hypothetical protein